MPQNPEQRRVSEAEIEEEEVRYRLRQFYMIVLVADKARLQAMEENPLDPAKKELKPE